MRILSSNLLLTTLVLSARGTTQTAAPQWIQARTVTADAWHSAAYDSTRQRLVVFSAGTGGSQRHATREWDGTIWVVRQPAVQPTPRSEAAMAYDSARRRTVLFGGAVNYNDTWEWDGDEWAQRQPPVVPSPRAQHAMVFDAARQRILLFGGVSPSGARLDDTWEFDGSTWTQLTPLTRPNRRSRHTMAYDASRQRVVMFGGQFDSPTPPPPSVWEWDGLDWREVQAAGPGHRAFAAMTFDAVRGRVVMFGGADWLGGGDPFAELWDWDGQSWSARTLANAPGGRYAHTLTFDAARGHVVLFGGADRRGLAWSETWRLDATGWSKFVQAEAPRGRVGHALVHHAATATTLLFGGVDSRISADAFADTWLWRVHGWERLALGLEPPARVESAACYDPARQRTLVFGGSRDWSFQFDRLRGDTWEWDGAAWQSRVVVGPAPRRAASMAADPQRGEVILFGGHLGLSIENDTWRWNGQSWARLSPTVRPSARYGHAMAYDAARGRIVLFGGSTALGHDNSTWEWDGSDWQFMATSVAPAPRVNAALAWDADRQRIVLYGGQGSTPTLSGTWAWDGQVWTVLATDGPPQRFGAQHQTMTYDTVGRRLMYFGATRGASDETWVFAAQPAGHLAYGNACAGSSAAPRLTSDLPFLGAPRLTLECASERPHALCILQIALVPEFLSLGQGCSLYTGAGSIPIPLLNDGVGIARWSTPIILEPSLVGALVFTQALVSDPGSSVFGFAFSAGRALQFGH